MKEFMNKHPYIFWELVGVSIFIIYAIYASVTPIEKVNGALGGIALLEMMIAPIVIAIIKRDSYNIKDKIKGKSLEIKEKISENSKESKEKKESLAEIKKEEKRILREEREKERQIQKELDAKWNKVVKKMFEVNEEEKLIKVNNRVYNFDDILDAELLEDGNSVIKSSLLGTAAKGFLFGAAGYLSKSKKTQSMCNKLEVKITIKDLNNPVEYIKLIRYNTPKTGFIYKAVYDQAQKCVSIINIIIEKRKENK